MELISTTISFEMDCHNVVQSSLGTAIDIKNLVLFSLHFSRTISRRNYTVCRFSASFTDFCTSVLATIQWNVVSQNECGRRFHAPISLPFFSGVWKI